MKVEFITNSSFLITLADGRTLLTDPWYRGGAYYGSWYHYPPVSDADLERYRQLHPDWIYISHLHPDHLDPDTLCRFAPSGKVIIGKLPHNHLLRSIKAAGIKHVVELPLETPTDVDGLRMTIYGPFSATSEAYADDVNYIMDTSISVVDHDGVQLLNVNDNPIQVSNARQLRELHGSPEIAMLPYCGASAYPHMFPQYSDEEKMRRKSELTERMLHKFMEVVRALKPKIVVPVAGEYVLGGRNAPYTKYLHQATPEQLNTCWHSASLAGVQLCLLSTGDVMDSSGKVTRNPDARHRDFTEAMRLEYAMSLQKRPLDHEELRVPTRYRLPWPRLLLRARSNLWTAQQKLKLFPACDIELHIDSRGRVGGSAPPAQFCFPLDKAEPYAEGAYARREGRQFLAFHIDEGLLLMTMLGGAIWNNIEVGSLIEFERQPDRFDPTLHSLMSFFVL